MNHKLTAEVIEFIISRLAENAKVAACESNCNKSDNFALDRRLAYYEMMDIINSELEVRDISLCDLGIDINIEDLV